MSLRTRRILVLSLLAAYVSVTKSFSVFMVPSSTPWLVQGRFRKPSLNPTQALKLTWLSSEEEKVKAYDAVSTAWSFSAASSILSSPKTLPVVTTTLTSESVRALWALPPAAYLLFLLTVRSLQHAATKGLLKSDTYKRLNCGLALSSAVMLAVTVSTWLDSPLKSASSFAPRALSVLSSVIALVISCRVWQLSLKEEGASVPKMISEFAKGGFQSITNVFSPTSVLGVAYRILSVGLALQAAAALVCPHLVLVSFLGQAMSEGIGAIRAWGAMLIFQTICTYCLADAADRFRLNGTTFRDLNAGMVLTLIIQAALFIVAQSKSNLFIPAVAKATLVGYCAISSVFVVLCTIQNLNPSKATSEETLVHAPASAAAQDKRLTADGLLKSANEAVLAKNTSQAKTLYNRAEAMYKEIGILSEPQVAFNVKAVEKALRLADWKFGVEALTEMSDAEWQQRKLERILSQGTAASILAKLQNLESEQDAKSDAKEIGDEAFELADELVASGDWSAAKLQMDLAEEKWGIAGLLGLSGKPFEAALDGLRAKLPITVQDAVAERNEEQIGSLDPVYENQEPVSSAFAKRLTDLASARAESLTSRIMGKKE